MIDDNGIRYQIGCSSETIAGPENGGDAPQSFKDCFALCDDSLAIYGMRCTSFYYTGAPNGDGPGSCFFMDNDADGFRPADSSRVAAIRADFPVATTTTTSSTSSSSSELPTTTVQRPFTALCAIAQTRNTGVA